MKSLSWFLLRSPKSSVLVSFDVFSLIAKSARATQPAASPFCIRDFFQKNPLCVCPMSIVHSLIRTD
jgi:hypothetical protein